MEMKVLNGYQDVNFGRSRDVQQVNSLNGTSFGSGNSSKVASRNSTASELRYNDSGPHREMAIDCPPNFVGIKKEPPRLPRPLSSVIQGTPSGSPKGSFLSLTNTPRKAQAQPPVGGFGTSQSTGSKARSGNVDRVDPVVYSQSLTKSTFERDDQDRSERYRRLQEEIARRKEMEERVNQQQELLRASLRGSKKMQDLEERRARARALEMRDGFDNPNYRNDDEYKAGDDRVLSAERLQLGMQRPVFSSPYENQAVENLNIQDIINSLKQAKEFLSDADDKRDLNRVAQFVVGERFQRMLRVYNRLVEASLHQVPLLDSTLSTQSSNVCQKIVESITPAANNNRTVNELVALLNDVHFRYLLFAYDRSVQNKLLSHQNAANDEEPVGYHHEGDSEYVGDNKKLVRILKTADPLGATVRNDGDSIIVGRIVKGGAAEKSGLLHEGDEILEINGVEVLGKSINEVCDLMSTLTGILSFLIKPGVERGRNDLLMHVRALYSYDPEEDPYIPCRELGISFLKGDILHVINQDDNCWWQAYRDGEEDQTLAGLIPSRSFQEQKEKLRILLLGEKKDDDGKKNGCHRCKRKKKNTFTEESEDILTYEEVAFYYPQPNRKRPVVLIGPPNVGRQELRQRLMQSDFDRFAAAIPHTSRLKRETEIHGRDYFFVSRHSFEADIADGRLVEYGEYEKHLFGTSMEAIRQVVNSGKICVLNFHPQSIQIMRSSDLKPYFIFVAPPNIEKLKKLRQRQGVKVTDDELKSIIEKARQMEESYGQYFDMIIVNQDLDRAYAELLVEINRLEIEPQWVPVSWVT